MTAAAYEGRDNTILHEQAHMWFGDLVTMTWWDDLWLNESFAEWASHFAQDEIRQAHGGADPWATFCNQRKTWAYRQDQLPSTHPIAADMVDLEAVELNFDGITYAKGASVLRQLVAFVGLEAFLAGVRAYFHGTLRQHPAERPAGRPGASPPDATCRSWSAQWLETAGVNTLTPEFDSTTEGRFTSFDVRADRGRRTGRRCVAPHRRRPLRPDRDGLSRTERVETDIGGATGRRARAGRDARSPTWCWSTTTTSRTPRCGSIRGAR